MHRYVVGIAFHTDLRTILLLRKARPAWQSGMLNGPGGKVEPGESFVAAMVREFKEETNLDVPAEQWREAVIYHGDDFELRFFTATIPNLLSARALTDEPLVFAAVHDLCRIAVLPNLRWVVPLCLDDRIAFPIEMRVGPPKILHG